MKKSNQNVIKILCLLLFGLLMVPWNSELDAQCRLYNRGVTAPGLHMPSGSSPFILARCARPGNNLLIGGLVRGTTYTIEEDRGQTTYLTVYESRNSRVPVAHGYAPLLFHARGGGSYKIVVSSDHHCNPFDSRCRQLLMQAQTGTPCTGPLQMPVITPGINMATMTYTPGNGVTSYSIIFGFQGSTTPTPGGGLGNILNVPTGGHNPSQTQVFNHLKPCRSYEYYILEDCPPNTYIYGPFYFMTGGNVCADPSGLTSSNITSNTADVNWTPGANSSTYTLEVGYAGFANDGSVDLSTPSSLQTSAGYVATFTGAIGSGGPPVTITGLLDKEMYDVYLYEDCGNCGESNVIGPLPITTLPIPMPPALPCTNGGFEAANFTQWNGTLLENILGGALPLGSGLFVTAPNTLDQPGNVLFSRHSLMPNITWAPTGMDPILLTGNINLPVVSPFGGGNSVRLGNADDGFEAERLEKTFLVDINTATFNYAYALLLEDSHGNGGESFFTSRFYDQNCNLITDGFGLPIGVTHSGNSTDPLLTQVNVSWNSGNPGSAVGSTVFYRDWSCVVQDLTAFIGQEVTVEFTTSDCGFGAHLGYAYIDDVCDNCSTNPGNSAGSLTATVEDCGPGPIDVTGSFNPPFITDVLGNQTFGTPIDVIYYIYQTDGGTPTQLFTTAIGTGGIYGSNFFFQIPGSSFPTGVPDGFDIVVDIVFNLNGTIVVTGGTPGMGLEVGVDNDVMLDCGNGCPTIIPDIDLTADVIDLTNNLMTYTFTDATVGGIGHIEWIIDGVNLTELNANASATTTPAGLGQFGPFPASFQVGDNPGTSISLTYSPTGIHNICLVTFYWVGNICCHDTICVPFGCIHACPNGGGGSRIANLVEEGAVITDEIVHNPIGNALLSALGSEGVMDVRGVSGQKLTGFTSLMPSAASYHAEIRGLDLANDGDRVAIQVEGKVEEKDRELLGSLFLEKNGQMIELSADFNKLEVTEMMMEVSNHGEMQKGRVAVEDLASILGLNGLKGLNINTDDKNEMRISFFFKGTIKVFSDAFNAMGNKITLIPLNQKPLVGVEGVNYLTAGSNDSFTLITETIRESLPEGTCSDEISEPNDEKSSAYPVFPRYQKDENLHAHLCPAGDVDWYTFKVTTLSKENHEITLFNLPKDYNLEVFNEEGILIASGEGVSERFEKTTLNNLAEGTYYVKVFSRSGAHDKVKGYSLQIKESGEMSEIGKAYVQKLTAPRTFGFSIYPNPSSGEVKVSFESSNEGGANVKVYSITGVLMMKSEVQVFAGKTELDLDVSALNAGTYLIKIEQEGRSQTGKLLLTK